MTALYIGLMLAAFTGWVHAETAGVLLIDLADPDPDDLGLLPGASDLEIAAIARVTGPGPPGLEDRLQGTGLPQERLRLWAPYLTLTTSSGVAQRWTLRASVRGEEGRKVGSRIRATIGRAGVQGTWVVEGRPERADVRGTLTATASGFDVTAGSIACGFAQADPWEDPVVPRGSRSTTVPAAVLRSNERLGSRGIVLDRVGVGTIGTWRDRATGEGLAIATCGARNLAVIAGGTERAGKGLAIRLAAGEVVFRCAGHLPSGLPPSLAFDVARRGRTRSRIHAAWSLRPRGDGVQGRIGGTASGRVASLNWSSSISALGPASGKRSPVVADFGVEGGNSHGSVSATVAWDRGTSGSVKISHAIPVMGVGFSHIESKTDIGVSQGCRSRLRMTLVRAPLRIEIDPPAIGSVSSAGGRTWRWGIALLQRGA